MQTRIVMTNRMRVATTLKSLAKTQKSFATTQKSFATTQKSFAAAVVAVLFVVVLFVTVLGAGVGCTKAPAKKAKPAADGAAVDNGPPAEDSDGGLEGIDFDTALLVDNGRVEVCSPTDWTRGPQSKGYLVKYIPGRKKTYPSIVVMAADAPEGMAEVEGGEQGNHGEFVAAVAASLAGTYTQNGKSTLIKKPAAVTLGPHCGVTWAAPATISVDGMRESIDRMSYAVVFGGRMYTVEVRAPKGKLDAAGRSVARAVAAALAPPQAAEAAPAATEPAAETPAE
jgi:hypothetical protein